MTETRGLPTTEKPRQGRGRKNVPVPDTSPAVPPTKLEQMVAMLSRPEGVGLAELAAATGWQAHSVRGALAGSLKRRGYSILSEKLADERLYWIEAGQ